MQERSHTCNSCLGGYVIYLKAVILAIVEGATEFLPVSSTGHLILVEEIVQLSDDSAFNKAFMIIIQLPAILSVLVYFRKDLWPFGQSPERKEAIHAIWGKTLVGVIPAIILGSIFGDYLESHLFSPVPVATALFLGGLVLIGIEWRKHEIKMESIADLSLRIVLLIGLFQCLAMIPGTSRSAATIIGAILLGVSRPAAAEFSFFLAIPTMIAASAYEIFVNGLTFSQELWGVVAVGSIVSFLVAYASIAGLMNYIRHHSFAVFGIYRIALALVVLVAVFMGWFGNGHP